MSARMIPLSELEPDADVLAYVSRVYARGADLAAVQQARQFKAAIPAEVLVDALDAGAELLDAAAIRLLVAHTRAGRRRWHELDAATASTAGDEPEVEPEVEAEPEVEPALGSRVPGAAWAAWRRSTVTGTDGATGRDL